MLWSSIWPSRRSEDRTVMFGNVHHWENWNKQHQFLCTYQEKLFPYFQKGKKNSQIECFKLKSSNARRSRKLCKTFVDTTKTQSKFERSFDIWAWAIALPLSVSNCGGTLRKTQNSKLFQHLKSSVVTCVAIRENCPQMFDGMVLL